MSRCEGTTRNGDQCKRDARAGSRFCHLHGGAEKTNTEKEGDPAEETLEWGDLVPLLLAGAMAAGLLFFLRSFGKWIPRI